MSVNKRILDYIRDNDVLLSEVAKKIGVAQSSLSRTLSSDDLKISQLIDITKALGLPVTYFFDGKEHIDNEEIEGYKKTIKQLQKVIDVHEIANHNKAFEAIVNILDSELKNEPEYVKNAFYEYKGFTGVLEMDEKLYKHIIFEVSPISKELIRSEVKKKLKEVKSKGKKN